MLLNCPILREQCRVLGTHKLSDCVAAICDRGPAKRDNEPSPTPDF